MLIIRRCLHKCIDLGESSKHGIWNSSPSFPSSPWLENFFLWLSSFCKQSRQLDLTCLDVWKISGLFLPAVVRPILDSFESSKQVPQPVLSDVSIKVWVLLPIPQYAELSDYFHLWMLFVSLVVYVVLLWIPVAGTWRFCF